MAFLSQDFQKIDSLSQEGKAFFFVVDFLKENVLIFDEKQLQNQEILVDFPHFKTANHFDSALKKLHFESESPSFENYKLGFDKVQKALKKGDTYLCNYTCKSKINTNAELLDFFHQSKAKYKVLLPEKWVFFSPETFICIDDNTVKTAPMKGTIDADVPDAKNRLYNDAKENAEHYTVVDLLRNDLSQIADEVFVSQFKRIDYLETAQKNLFAMSSEIEGKVKPEFQNKMGSILDAMLPAGSILGAPKAQTLKVILEAETYDRGFYTGIAGYFDGKNLDSCVMIRFLEKENASFYFKSGGGITHKSVCEMEFEEMKQKIYVPIY